MSDHVDTGASVTDGELDSTLPDADAMTAAVMADHDSAPAAGEDIHLPGGTPIPFLIAVALTLVLVGTTTDWLWTILGGILFAICLGLWIRDTRREVAHLPDELGSPAHH